MFISSDQPGRLKDQALAPCMRPACHSGLNPLMLCLAELQPRRGEILPGAARGSILPGHVDGANRGAAAGAAGSVHLNASRGGRRGERGRDRPEEPVSGLI